MMLAHISMSIIALMSMSRDGTYTASQAAIVELQPFVNPTGTYRLSERRSKRRGEMRVVLADRTHIAIRLVVSSGAPAFDAGLIVDTLEYANNAAVYNGADRDGGSCRIVLMFSRSGTRSDEDNAGSCSGTNGVATAGFYRRVNRRARTL